MKRFRGEELGSDAKIAILANDALGNFAVATPLAQKLRSSAPGGVIDYFGGERTLELESASVGKLYDRRFSLLGADFGDAIRQGKQRSDELGGYDLVINIEIGPAHKAFATALGGRFTCGPALSPDGRGDWAFPEDARGDLWRDPEWVSADLTAQYPFLESGFIGEVFFRLAYQEGALPGYFFPSEQPILEVPQVLISTGASLPSKLWPTSKWRELLSDFASPPGLLGAPPKRQRDFYHTQDSEQAFVDEGLVVDLRGKLSLPEVVGALADARLVVTIDNGILHFAAAAEAPTVGLYRRDIWRLWAPPNPNLRVVTPVRGDVDQVSPEQVREALRGLSVDQPLP